MRVNILQDVMALAGEVYPLPSFSDPTAVAVWVGQLSQGVTAVVYDAITSAPEPAVHCAMLQQATLSTFSEEEIEDAFEALKTAGKFRGLPVEKIGDGTILNWMKTVNWAQLIQTVISIISVIPKTTPAAS